jgi:hypothetical protein
MRDAPLHNDYFLLVKSSFAGLPYSRITLLTVVWAFVVVAAPRLVVGAFYTFHWLQKRTSRVPGNATFFATFRWTAWWVPAIIVVALPVLLLIGRVSARSISASF